MYGIARKLSFLKNRLFDKERIIDDVLQILYSTVTS